MVTPVGSLNSCKKAYKENTIEWLKKRIDSPKSDNDKLEQYSRRPNLRFEGISEAVGAADVENELICIINNKMKMTPRRFRKLSACTKIGRQVAEGRPPPPHGYCPTQVWTSPWRYLQIRGNLKTNSTTLVSNRIFLKLRFNQTTLGAVILSEKAKESRQKILTADYRAETFWWKTKNMKIRQIHTKLDLCF